MKHGFSLTLFYYFLALQRLTIYTTSDALIRLAPYAREESGARQVAPAIAPNSLTLSSSDKGMVKPQQIMSQAQIQSAGFTMAKFQQYKNFNLVDIKLMDQSRMMVQQVQASDNTI